jgi:hypothetical protein
MNDMEYRVGLIKIAAAVHSVKEILGDLDLGEWIRASSFVDTVGPFTDPTGWRQLGDEMPNRIQQARAVLALLNAARQYPIAITAEQLEARLRPAVEVITGADVGEAMREIGEAIRGGEAAARDVAGRFGLIPGEGETVVCKRCNGAGILQQLAGEDTIPCPDCKIVVVFGADNQISPALEEARNALPDAEAIRAADDLAAEEKRGPGRPRKQQ